MPALSNRYHNDTAYEANGGSLHSVKKDHKSSFKEHTNGAHGSINGLSNGTTNGVKRSHSPYPAPSTSVFTPICHPKVDDAIRDVDGYYLQHWGFPNEAAKQKFVNAGFSRVTCLYFPKALNERINYSCSLLTILFLIDGRYRRVSLLLHR